MLPVRNEKLCKHPRHPHLQLNLLAQLDHWLVRLLVIGGSIDATLLVLSHPLERVKKNCEGLLHELREFGRF